MTRRHMVVCPKHVWGLLQRLYKTDTRCRSIMAVFLWSRFRHVLSRAAQRRSDSALLRVATHAVGLGGDHRARGPDASTRLLSRLASRRAGARLVSVGSLGADGARLAPRVGFPALLVFARNRLRAT